MSPTARFTFSTFDVTRQVFYSTRLSYGLVNLKPIVPGHVLVVPRRVVRRLHELTGDEMTDIFETVRRVGQVVEKAYQGEALTIACQDGPAAGQSVPHVHIHILPRKFTDFGGRNDEVYPLLESGETELGERLSESSESNVHTVREPKPKPKPKELKVDDEGRQARSTDEMESEATWLSGFFDPTT